MSRAPRSRRQRRPHRAATRPFSGHSSIVPRPARRPFRDHL